jgi:hypothetical protein
MAVTSAARPRLVLHHSCPALCRSHCLSLSKLLFQHHSVLPCFNSQRLNACWFATSRTARNRHRHQKSYTAAIHRSVIDDPKQWSCRMDVSTCVTLAIFTAVFAYEHRHGGPTGSFLFHFWAGPARHRAHSLVSYMFVHCSTAHFRSNAWNLV